MCSPSIPVLSSSAHLSPGLPPCFGPLRFYCAPQGCFWPASLSRFLWGPCQSCKTVIVRSLSEDVSNKSPSPSSFLFTQPLHVITDLILPFNIHYPSQASVLKHIDFLSITSVHFPCFATIRENWFDQCFV